MVSASNPDAFEIMERMLAETNRGLLGGDFVPFRAWFALPLDVYAFKGHTVCRTEEDLQAIFQRAVTYYQKIGVSDLVRVIREATFSNTGTLRCFFETRVIVGRHTLHEEPFFCLNELECTNGRWQVRRAEYDLQPADVKHSVLLGHSFPVLPAHKSL